MPGASNTRRKLGGGQCGRNLRQDWDESCLHGTQWVQMEQCFKVNVLKSGFSITNYDITVPTTQVCDHRTQLWLWIFRLQEHFNQGENLKVNGSSTFFFREQQKCPYFTGTWILFHSHIFFKAICGVPDPKKCPKLWWVFIFMHNWSAGECGVKEGHFCVSGKSTVSSPENTAYALCALELLSPSSFPFYLHIKIVIWAMSETTFF